MGDTTTEVDPREQIRKVLEDRMDEYFRPGHDTWRLNSADLARVVGDIVAGEVARLSTEFEGRGYQRDEIGDDDSDGCDTHGDDASCHTVAAVATWFRAAALLRRHSGTYRGGGSDVQ